MIRIVIFLVSVSLLSVILSPFIEYILQLKWTIAYTIASTNMVSSLSITAVFSFLSWLFALSIYRFFH